MVNERKVLVKLRADKLELMKLLSEQHKAQSVMRRVKREKIALVKDVRRLKAMTSRSLLSKAKRLARDKGARGRVTKPLRRAGKQLKVAKRKAKRAFSSFQDFADRFGS